jgi:hypothetical protein
MAASGWYPDPFERYPQRYWDGTQWTPWVSDGQRQFPDPALAPQPSPAGAVATTAAPAPRTGSGTEAFLALIAGVLAVINLLARIVVGVVEATDVEGFLAVQQFFPSRYTWADLLAVLAAAVLAGAALVTQRASSWAVFAAPAVILASLEFGVFVTSLPLGEWGAGAWAGIMGTITGLGAGLLMVGAALAAVPALPRLRPSWMVGGLVLGVASGALLTWSVLVDRYDLGFDGDATEGRLFTEAVTDRPVSLAVAIVAVAVILVLPVMAGLVWRVPVTAALGFGVALGWLAWESIRLIDLTFPDVSPTGGLWLGVAGALVAAALGVLAAVARAEDTSQIASPG